MSDEYNNLGGLGGLNGLSEELPEDYQQGLGLDGGFSSFEMENDEPVAGGLKDFDMEGEDAFHSDLNEFEESLEGGLKGVEQPKETPSSILDGLENGLSGLGNGVSGEGLSGDASINARDAANMANRDAGYSMGMANEPQSLKDYDTLGMGEGLSAVKESLGGTSGGIELHAGLEEEEEEEPIRAALADEEEEEPIRAGRSDPDPINAGYGKPQQAVGGRQEEVDVNFNMTDNYGISDNSLASDSKQSIDDIFIAGSFNQGSSNIPATSATGGTMYNPEKEHTNVHVSFGIPPIIKRLLIFVVILVGVYCILEYGFHIRLENYIHPVDVQEYFASDTASVEEALSVEFSEEKENYSSSTYEYTYDVQNHGGLKLVNYNGKRMYIEVTGTRINYSIFGIRPQMTKYEDAVTILAGIGFAELTFYEETEELGAQGEEHVFYNERTGEGVIVGKKTQYSSVKAIKYMADYRKYHEIWSELRGEAAQ